MYLEFSFAAVKRIVQENAGSIDNMLSLPTTNIWTGTL